MTEGAVSRRFTMACWVFIALSFVLQGAGVLHRNVNGDEFIFLNRIHALDQGRPLALLQTAYAWLFLWLPGIGENEVVQVQMARGVLLALWALTLFLLYKLTRVVTERPAALAAVALAAVFREHVIHAAAFRVDGLLAPVFLGACLAAARPTRARAAAAGVLAGIMVVLSIKAVLLLPVVAAVLAVGPGRDGLPPIPDSPWWAAAVRRAGLWAAVLAVTAAGVVGLHGVLVSTGSASVAGGPSTTGAFLRNAGFRMLLEGGFMPRLGTLLASVRWNAPLWLFLVVGLVVARSRPAFRLHVIFVAPLAAFLMYRNFFPYAFVSLGATLWIPAGVGLWWVVRRGGAMGRWVVAGSALWIVATGLAEGGRLRTDGTLLQRQTLDVVHELFPEPVPYIDRVGMVASFPRPLFNMTTFGMETYRAEGRAAFSAFIDEHRPPLLIRNTTSLDVFPDAPAMERDPRPALLPADALRVAETYAHFWGPIFLAGRGWPALEAGSAVAFTISMAGPYTLLSQVPVSVDGVGVAPGGTVTLSPGVHRLVSREGSAAEVKLLWGRQISVPAFPPPPGRVFYGF